MSAAPTNGQALVRRPNAPRPVFRDPEWYRGRAEYFARQAESAQATGHFDVAATLERWSAEFRTLAEQLRGVRP